MRAWSIARIIAARAGSAVKLASESAEGGAFEPAEGRSVLDFEKQKADLVNRTSPDALALPRSMLVESRWFAVAADSRSVQGTAVRPLVARRQEL